ncbi:MAG: hypothetical protein HKP30_01495 [Myxococcales bacterium]|nr:hypothetical protein [Myxococcales bacterium]
MDLPGKLRPRHLQILGAAALLLIPLLVYVHFIRFDPEVAFLPGDDATPWLTFPYPINTSVRAADTENPEVFRFARAFKLAAVPGDAVLTVRAFRHFEVTLNGSALSLPPDRPQWRDPVRLPVADRLVPGANELAIEVWNPVGPPVLQASLLGEGLRITTDALWSVTAPGRSVVRARLASDTRPVPEATREPGPGDLLAEHAFTLLALFAVSALLATLLPGRIPAVWLPHVPLVVTALLTLFWSGLFLQEFIALPFFAGFDVGGHLEYVEFIRRERALPLASDGFEMFHPPLFYLLSAALASLAGAPLEVRGALPVHHVVPFLAGLGMVWTAWLLARRLFRADPLRASLAVGFVGLLPMNLYMSAYVSNETLSALCANLAGLATCALLLSHGAPARWLAALALAIGLALLTKYTVILLVPVMLFFVACKLFLLGERTLLGTAAVLAALVAGVAAVAGWYYARNLVHFGEPVVVNWAFASGKVWWHLPGFHTLDFFTSFGESVRRPFLAGFHSFWDGLYATFWGDGLIAGRAAIAGRHDGWNYELMTLGYALALPATALLGFGALRAFWLSFRCDDLRRRMVWAFLLTVVWAPLAAQIALGIRYPSYAASKAFYLLVVAVPIACLAAEGLAWLPERFGDAKLPRALYFGWLGATAGVLGLAFAA